MAKTPNNNTPIKKNTNSGYENIEKDYPEYMDFFDVFTMRLRPINEAWLEKLAKELVEWAKDENSFKFTQFLSDRGLPHTSFYSWIKRSEALAEAHKYTIMTLGARREWGGLSKQLDSSMIKASMPIYDRDWKKLEEWRSDLKQKENDSEKPKIVVIEKFPDAPKLTPEEVAKKVSMKGENKTYYEPRGV